MFIYNMIYIYTYDIYIYHMYIYIIYIYLIYIYYIYMIHIYRRPCSSGISAVIRACEDTGAQLGCKPSRIRKCGATVPCKAINFGKLRTDYGKYDQISIPRWVCKPTTITQGAYYTYLACLTAEFKRSHFWAN
jgi:hypothetical protein